MPQLDGVSATAWIREIHQRVPIIAMTSNIRQEDIETYYQYGECLRIVAARLTAADMLINQNPRHERRARQALHQGRHGAHPTKALGFPYRAAEHGWRPAGKQRVANADTNVGLAHATSAPTTAGAGLLGPISAIIQSGIGVVCSSVLVDGRCRCRRRPARSPYPDTTTPVARHLGFLAQSLTARRAAAPAAVWPGAAATAATAWWLDVSQPRRQDGGRSYGHRIHGDRYGRQAGEEAAPLWIGPGRRCLCSVTKGSELSVRRV